MIAASVAVAVAAGTLWARRDTWGSRWESAATLTVAGLGLHILLLHPHVSRHVSPFLHTATRLWNVEDLIGHIAYLTGLSALFYMALSRLKMTEHARLRYLRQRLELPATVYLPLLIGCFVASGCGGSYVSDLVFSPVTFALGSYWLLLVGGAGYLLTNTVRALLILQRDPRSRTVATWYLTAVAVSVCRLSCLLLSVGIDGMAVSIWRLTRIEVIAYAAVATYSWYRKICFLQGRAPDRRPV
ncbi:hypothetical protein KIH27_07875 [Mycobacterium sp. M1]|uniref:DUF2306 domain-containing protein n=1 Tax=Mycolicibacter acidiphilus TaxID=2835306 RepID=A0ABS5RGT1_9MYCO|nr:hypothetical protein [Mycolicibacter acidiphilus]MBS9533505.1 hypothetical protein [Mycolicibacter acidiphilus]